jgi:hypothetical protein
MVDAMTVFVRPLVVSALPALGLAGALLGGAPAWSQAKQDDGGSIYTCVDAQGRRLTSDRPIMACIDREQRVLSSSGTLRRVIQPSLTASEREARELREREATIARQRALNLIRRDQALITRYPDRSAHDAARAEALAQTQTVIDAAERRIAELAAERKALDDEMEFYRKDPSQAPPRVRRAIEDNALSVQTQHRAIAGQQEERNRIHARFDEEAERLQPLWRAKAEHAAQGSQR